MSALVLKRISLDCTLNDGIYRKSSSEHVTGISQFL